MGAAARAPTWCLLAAALLAAPGWAQGDATPSGTLGFDPAHTRFGFELHTRWGQALDGRFPRYDGEVDVLPDGRRQVQLRLYTADVEIVDHPRYSEWARSDRFFGAARYPQVSWVSEPFDPQLLRNGGEIAGDLSIRGIKRPKTLQVAPAPVDCAHPGYDCDAVASGAINRSDYDMTDWKMAINDRVEFMLRVRLRPVAP